MRNKANISYEIFVIITSFKLGNHQVADIHRKNRKRSYILYEGAIKNGVPIQGTLSKIHLNKSVQSTKIKIVVMNSL